MLNSKFVKTIVLLYGYKKKLPSSRWNKYRKDKSTLQQFSHVWIDFKTKKKYLEGCL